MDKKVVLVTGIGGNVGQGILRNIKNSPYSVKLIGCNTTKFSGGNFFCEKTYKVPFATDKAYINEINKIVKKERVDLIIPSTDYEVYHLAKNKEKIKCEVAVSGLMSAEIYLDKYKSYLHHKKFGIAFAESVLPSKFNGQFKNLLAKPKMGRGSRGIILNPKDISVFKDKDYMIQQLHEGIELTTAFYITKARKLLGYITFERKLENGTTVLCSVNKKYDKQVEKIILKMIETTDLKGSVNLQFIADKKNKLHPFEINCRISGTNSIRSNFGFKDVEYVLEEYLYNKIPKKPKLINGTAVRILTDIIYPGKSIKQIEGDKLSNAFLF